jgi:uncharacterized protein
MDVTPTKIANSIKKLTLFPSKIARRRMDISARSDKINYTNPRPGSTRLLSAVRSVKIFSLQLSAMAPNASLNPTAESKTRAPELEAKERELRLLMQSMGKMLVAYSGGVDSSYLCFIANQEAKTNALAVLGVSPSVSKAQRRQASEFALANGFSYREITTHELADRNYSANPTNRCFFCKSELYSKLSEIAAAESIEFVLDGTNADDLSDIRHGRKAAEQFSVRSPLAELGFTKADIRELSRIKGIEGWDKPSSPCLASRIAYGIPVTRERLGQVERAERVLSEMGFREFRVRAHGEIARIEICKEQMGDFLNSKTFETVGTAFKSLGFKHVTLDLEGFRSGSLN